MIKKVPFLFISFLFLKTLSFGQNCVPDPQYTNPDSQRGTHPDTTTNLGPATAGTPYSQTITILIPPDTVIFNWDSTVLVGVTGLPPGFSYSCTNNSAKPNLCSWKGNSIGCIVITGTPSVSDIGTHPLLFSINNYLGGNTTPNPATAKGYKIVVNAVGGVNENPNIQVMQQNNPNPFEDLSEIQFMAEDNGIAEFKIYNLIGTVIRQYDVSVKKGINKIELNAKEFDSGIYFYSLAHGPNAFTRKMIVKK